MASPGDLARPEDFSITGDNDSGDFLRPEVLSLAGERGRGGTGSLRFGDLFRVEGFSLTGECDAGDLDLARFEDLLRLEGLSIPPCELLCRAGDLSLRDGLLLRGDPRRLAGGDSESLRPIGAA